MSASIKTVQQADVRRTGKQCRGDMMSERAKVLTRRHEIRHLDNLHSRCHCSPNAVLGILEGNALRSGHPQSPRGLEVDVGGRLRVLDIVSTDDMLEMW